MKAGSPSVLFLCLLTLSFASADEGNKIQIGVAQPLIQAMVSEKYAAYKEAYGLPEGAGVLVRLETPGGSAAAMAGLPAGADENWRYRIASVSKTFTAASIMLLDQRGKIDIEDVLTDMIPGTDVPYLADSPNYAIPYKDRITIRQILSHRAGIFDVFNNPIPESSAYPYAGQYYNYYVYGELREEDHQFTADELMGVVAANKLATGEPGKEYHYSDTGYTLLVKIVERASGQSYDRFLADNFWEPLHLERTSAPWNGNDTGLPRPYMPGHVSDGTGFFDMTEDNMSSQVGPGNIISTPADMARWIRALFSGRGPLEAETDRADDRGACRKWQLRLGHRQHHHWDGTQRSPSRVCQPRGLQSRRRRRRCRRHALHRLHETPGTPGVHGGSRQGGESPGRVSRPVDSTDGTLGDSPRESPNSRPPCVTPSPWLPKSGTENLSRSACISGPGGRRRAEQKNRKQQYGKRRMA